MKIKLSSREIEALDQATRPRANTTFQKLLVFLSGQMNPKTGELILNHEDLARIASIRSRPTNWKTLQKILSRTLGKNLDGL